MIRFAAFLFPVWILGFPSLMYWHGRANNLIPTETEWESAAHSSGPWQANYGLVLTFTFILGCVIHISAVATFLQLRQQRTAAFWAFGGLLGFVCSLVSFHLFGYLIE